MTRPDPVSELDLLAYADGLLNQDPERKARVEAYLRAAPEAAERVDAYAAQTRSLRAAYGPRAGEPVPDRLQDVLNPPAARSRMRLTGLRAAAVLALSAAAGATGWYIGQVSGPESLVGEPRLPSVLRKVVSDEHAGLRTLPVSADNLAPGGVLRWNADGVGLSLSLPDLSPMGYDLSARRNVTQAGAQVVALSYESRDGAKLRLVVAPASSGQSRVIAVSEENGTQIAHWSQGPLAFAVQSEDSGRELAALARDIRATIGRESPMRHREPRPPEFQLAPSKVEVRADAISPQTPDGVEQPATHTTIGSDTVIE